MSRRPSQGGCRHFRAVPAGPSTRWTGTHRARARRGGLTLFEIVLALGIFLSSLAALAQLIDIGVQAAVKSRLQTQAILRCRSKLSEVAVGVEPMVSVRNVSFADDPNWQWTLEVTPGLQPDLLELDLTVVHVGESTLGQVSFSLRRYARDPQIFLDPLGTTEESEEGGL